MLVRELADAAVVGSAAALGKRSEPWAVAAVVAGAGSRVAAFQTEHYFAEAVFDSKHNFPGGSAAVTVAVVASGFG